MRPVGGLAPPARLGWCRQTGSLNLAAGPAATVSARLVAAATATAARYSSLPVYGCGHGPPGHGVPGPGGAERQEYPDPSQPLRLAPAGLAASDQPDSDGDSEVPPPRRTPGHSLAGGSDSLRPGPVLLVLAKTAPGRRDRERGRRQGTRPETGNAAGDTEPIRTAAVLTARLTGRACSGPGGSAGWCDWLAA